MLNKSSFVPFGTEIPKAGIQKFSAKNGDTRIRILSTQQEDFLFARTHYLKGIGSFHCFNGSCCHAVESAGEDGNTQERAILPVAVYTASPMGTADVEFQYLALPEAKYSALVTLNTQVGDVSSYDLLVQCSDEKYQKYSFVPLIGQQSVLDAIPGIQDKINSFIQNYRRDIMKSVAPKEFNEATFQAARAKSLQQAASNVGVNFTPNATASAAFVNPAIQLSQPTVALPTIQQAPAVNPQIVQPTVVTQPVVTPVVPTVVTQVAETVVVPDVKITETKIADVTPTQQVSAPKVETPVVETTTTDSNYDMSIDWSAMLPQ